MTIYLAADHAGFDAKEAIKTFLTTHGHQIEDCGAPTLDTNDDYPDYMTPCAKKVAGDAGSFGIIFGASGQGEAMAANRVPGVRCAVYYAEAAHPQTDTSGASLGIIESERAHNDANILSLGARFLTHEQIAAAVTIFLATPFSGDERHVRRIKKF